MSVLDAGCGSRRNFVYFLRNGFEVFAVDRNLGAIRHMCDLATSFARQLPVGNFQVSEVEAMPFPDERFDVLISSAILHFA